MLSYIIIASILVSLISFSGGIIFIWKSLYTKRFLTYFVSFAAGVMLTAAFLDLLPKALEESGRNTNIFLPSFIGIITFFFLERFLLWFHRHDKLHGTKPPAVLVLLGDTLHNFVDGVAIAVTFMTSTTLGIATTLAIAAHEVPQEIADFTILMYSGMKKTKALLFNFLTSLTALAGAVAGFYFFDKVEDMLSFFLAFTAGMFIYIACSDLIPEIHKDNKRQKGWTQSIPFVLGIILIYLLVTVLEG